MKKKHKIWRTIILVGLIGYGIYWHQTATIIWNGYKITKEGIIFDFPNEEQITVPSHVLGGRVKFFSSAEGPGKDPEDKSKIKKIIFNNNDKLEEIELYGLTPNVQEVDLSKVKNIKTLALITNEDTLLNLDVSNNKELRKLYVGGLKSDTIDISQNIKLQRFDCTGCGLKTLDVSKNIELESLVCIANNLKALNIRKNIKLDALMCSSNQLTELDVSKNTQLTYLSCFFNNITTLGLRNNKKLEKSDIDVDETVEIIRNIQE